MFRSSNTIELTSPEVLVNFVIKLLIIISYHIVSFIHSSSGTTLSWSGSWLIGAYPRNNGSKVGIHCRWDAGLLQDTTHTHSSRHDLQACFGKMGQHVKLHTDKYSKLRIEPGNLFDWEGEVVIPLVYIKSSSSNRLPCCTCASLISILDSSDHI